MEEILALYSCKPAATHSKHRPKVNGKSLLAVTNYYFFRFDLVWAFQLYNCIPLLYMAYIVYAHLLTLSSLPQNSIVHPFTLSYHPFAMLCSYKAVDHSKKHSKPPYGLRPRERPEFGPIDHAAAAGALW